jgi:hypothetical protein
MRGLRARGTVSIMKRLLRAFVLVGLAASLSSCALLTPNNDAAEAACIEQRGNWYRDEQRCAYPLNLDRLLPKNNDAAEAACVARGDSWFRDMQFCIRTP